MCVRESDIQTANRKERLTLIMDKCIGCRSYKHENGKWICTAPYKRCHKEELEYEESLGYNYAYESDYVDPELLEDEE